MQGRVTEAGHHGVHQLGGVYVHNENTGAAARQYADIFRAEGVHQAGQVGGAGRLKDAFPPDAIARPCRGRGPHRVPGEAAKAP